MAKAMGHVMALVAAEVRDDILNSPHCDGRMAVVDPAGTITSHFIPWLLVHDPEYMYDCKIDIHDDHADRILQLDEPSDVPLH